MTGSGEVPKYGQQSSLHARRLEEILRRPLTWQRNRFNADGPGRTRPFGRLVKKSHSDADASGRRLNDEFADVGNNATVVKDPGLGNSHAEDHVIDTGNRYVNAGGQVGADRRNQWERTGLRLSPRCTSALGLELSKRTLEKRYDYRRIVEGGGSNKDVQATESS